MVVFFQLKYQEASMATEQDNLHKLREALEQEEEELAAQVCQLELFFPLTFNIIRKDCGHTSC